MPYKVWKEKKTLFAKYKVRNYHVDSYGHVNNAVYLQFLEDGRTDFFTFFGYSLSYLAKNKIYVFITEIKIKYLKPLKLDDIIVVTGNISKIKKVRATWIQEIYSGNIKIATATVASAFVNSHGNAIRIPDFLLKPLYSIYTDSQG